MRLQPVHATELFRLSNAGDSWDLQHLIIDMSINLVRVLAWSEGKPLAKTCTSLFAAPATS